MEPLALSYVLGLSSFLVGSSKLVSGLVILKGRDV